MSRRVGVRMSVCLARVTLRSVFMMGTPLISKWRVFQAIGEGWGSVIHLHTECRCPEVRYRKSSPASVGLGSKGSPSIQSSWISVGNSVMIARNVSCGIRSKPAPSTSKEIPAWCSPLPLAPCARQWNELCESDGVPHELNFPLWYAVPLRNNLAAFAPSTSNRSCPAWTFGKA